MDKYNDEHLLQGSMKVNFGYIYNNYKNFDNYIEQLQIDPRLYKPIGIKGIEDVNHRDRCQCSIFCLTRQDEEINEENTLQVIEFKITPPLSFRFLETFIGKTEFSLFNKTIDPQKLQIKESIIIEIPEDDMPIDPSPTHDDLPW